VEKISLPEQEQKKKNRKGKVTLRKIIPFFLGGKCLAGWMIQSESARHYEATPKLAFFRTAITSEDHQLLENCKNLDEFLYFPHYSSRDCTNSLLNYSF